METYKDSPRQTFHETHCDYSPVMPKHIFGDIFGNGFGGFNWDFHLPGTVYIILSITMKTQQACR